MAEILVTDNGIDLRVRVDKDKQVVIFDDGKTAFNISFDDFQIIHGLFQQAAFNITFSPVQMPSAPFTGGS